MNYQLLIATQLDPRLLEEVRDLNRSDRANLEKIIGVAESEYESTFFDMNKQRFFASSLRDAARMRLCVRLIHTFNQQRQIIER